MDATRSPRLTWGLIALVLVVAGLVLAFYPQAVPDPPEGRVLAQFRFVEPVGAGFRVNDTFVVADDYDRLTLIYNLTEAFYVRAAVTAPGGERYEAEPLSHPERGDELRLDVDRPERGNWTFELWTLDEPERQGRILGGDFHILGIGGKNMSRG
jgi:hypothetical protein